MTTQLGVRDIKAMLQDGVEPLCRLLLPAGRRKGNMWDAPAPHRRERTPGGAFVVWLQGPARGAFKDYGDPDVKGDIIDLIAFCRGSDRRDAIAYAKDFLGLGAMSEIERQRVREKTKQAAERAQKQDAQLAERKRAYAFELFMRGLSIHNEMQSGVCRRYFWTRNSPLSKLPNLDQSTYRFLPELEWWKGSEWAVVAGKKTKIKTGPAFPALLAAQRNAHGALTGVHATFLKPDGSGKADVDPPKLMLGRALGSVIRVAHGPTGLPPEEAGLMPGPLIVTEGNEDAWRAARAMPECRVWAAGSLSLIASAPVHLDCVAEVYVGQQNDFGNRAAENALEAAIETLAECGKKVVGFKMPNDVKDLGDMTED